MGWFSRYNDARAMSRGPKSIGKRAVYRGAMTIYHGGLPKRSSRTPGDAQAVAVAVLVAIGLAILLVVWLA